MCVGVCVCVFPLQTTDGTQPEAFERQRERTEERQRKRNRERERERHREGERDDVKDVY